MFRVDSRAARTSTRAANPTLGASSVGPVAYGYAPSLRPSDRGVFAGVNARSAREATHV